MVGFGCGLRTGLLGLRMDWTEVGGKGRMKVHQGVCLSNQKPGMTLTVGKAEDTSLGEKFKTLYG